ncbi:hypothetical protein VD0002_g3322 [Verticillium dahliae]|nr:Elongation factor 3 [Verticillium dahliae VDG2]PNH52869.1 hypothetical protein VD0003_g4506 [Verticillium dahliae]PNH65844.1 hypothetical protein VD0002_g3322 [Verticillium dahliae]
MASTYTMSNPYLHDDQGPVSQNQPTSGGLQYQYNGTPNSGTNHLTPFSPHLLSNSASPTHHNTNTPAESISNYSQYHTSEYSDMDDTDPFYGVDFNSTEGGTPSFLDENLLPLSRTSSFGTTPASQSFDVTRPRKTSDLGVYPFSPEQTASMHTPSPASDQRAFAVQQVDGPPTSVSPRDLQKPFAAPPVPTFVSAPVFQLTPDPSRSGRSSEEDLVSRHPVTTAQSPRVTVSLWGRDDDQPIVPLERTFTPDDDDPVTVRGSFSAAGDMMYAGDQVTSMPPPPHPKDESSIRRRLSSSSRRGLEPGSRTTAETESPNEMVTRREIEEKNVEVGKWLTGNVVENPPAEQSSSSIAQLDKADPNRQDDEKIPLGDQTENKYLSNQVYFHPGGGEMTQTDLDILHANSKWGDAPMSHPISSQGERFQPESSQAAIARYNKMWDNESIVSKAATWGTRRRSLPSLLDVDIESVTSGKLLKKLSIARGEGTRPDRGVRRPSLLQDLRGLVRRPSGSGLLKRSRSNNGEESPQPAGSQSPERRDSSPHLAPPARTSSWGNKKGPVPSINTALVSMGNSVASIGTTHARNSSISATSITSPRSPFNNTLQVKNTLRRPRSKSDLPKPSPSNETHSNLVGMWRKTGGPPVATLATSTNVDVEDEDEDEDDGDDGDMKIEPNRTISDITPTFAGFQQHILRLNPGLETSGNYLVDRIAHQQIIRYKQLLNFKKKHLQAGADCSCGPLCVALGGSATILDQKGAPKSLDPLSASCDIEDGNMTPIEGAITQDSFPTDIPMPLTPSLPAEFECQLCFQAKKFNKPSDWTKHVHEDVQPFTCTWDRCRDPKIFKRKADWVRHENEGHRHLEWWTCDVEDCTHTCYRRDNFLQHLVREHKFAEPKFKNKAAVKQQSSDPTWQKVEQCHQDTPVKPQDEPCRFCGKSFPSWKKLTVHLAKHMEQISLPILRLVAERELEPDTIISPVQDAPPRNAFNTAVPFNESISSRTDLSSQFRCGQATYPPPAGRPSGLVTDPRAFGNNNGVPFGYMDNMQQQYDDSLFSSTYGDNGQELHSSPLIDQTNGLGFGHADFQNMALPTNVYGGGQGQYMTVPPSGEPFPALDTDALGLHQPGMGPMSMDSSLQYGMLMGQGQGHGHGLGQIPAHPNMAQYAAQGRTSPYSRSPHQEMNVFYAPQ